MPGNNTNQEVEIKLRIKDVSALRHRLKKLRAREVSPRTYELNALYDSTDKKLARRGQLLRIRVEQPSSNGGRTLRKTSGSAKLTYKGPSKSSRDSRAGFGKPGKSGHYKIREELEVTVGDAELMSRILFRLGLRPAFRYEKFRTTYVLPGIRNLKIEFDEVPIGSFLELEGPVSAIDRAARLLGYTRSDYIKQTYGALYIAACRQRGQKPGDMLFTATKKMR